MKILSSKKWFVLLVIGLLIATSVGTVFAQQEPVQLVGESTEEVSPYLSLRHLSFSDGVFIDGAIINGPAQPPSGFAVFTQTAIEPLPSTGVLKNFPSFSWVFGCSAVSGAMIATYYDNKNYTNLYAGPKNNGKMPLTDTGWSTWNDGEYVYPNNPLIASHKGVDGRKTKGSIDDYWVSYFSYTPDPFLTGGWTQHPWATSIGDFMKTSQYLYYNVDGSTSFYNYVDDEGHPVKDKLTCDDMAKYGIDIFDGTYGRKLFYEARGYSVGTCYSQWTDNQADGGYSLADFKASIDSCNPVMINLAGHTVVGYGYGVGNTIFIRNTWDSDPSHVYKMQWGGSYEDMEMNSVSIVKLGPAVIPNPMSPTGLGKDATPTYVWGKVNKASSYRFSVLTADKLALKYSFEVNASKCGDTCKKTPVKALVPGNYVWQVQAKVGGTWQPYSDFKNFSIK